MSSSILSLTWDPRNPDVSMQVWIPIALAPASSFAANADCMSTSPPDTVSPPPEALNVGRYRFKRLSSWSTSTGSPSRIWKVSGLWQYRQRRGQPAMKIVIRTPGPSTAVTSSHE